MIYRLLSLSMLTLALGLLAVRADAAVKKDDAQSHQGTVVSAGGGKLVMTGQDGKEHSHTIGATTKITVDGKAAKLEDLKKGAAITVTMDKDHKVTSVASGASKTPKAATAPVSKATAPVAAPAKK